MKCWNSTFNAQSSRIIILYVHVKTLKIYVAIVEKLREKERRGQN
jgi:predicted oxidoreductase (fatty acid repression mutant protein)